MSAEAASGAGTAGVDVLLDRIDRVRSRERAVSVTEGGLRSLLVLLGCVAGFFLLDWLILGALVEGAEANRFARGVLVLAMLATVVYVFVRDVLWEVLRVRDDDEIALRVEERHPELHGRLISTIQLTRGLEAGTALGSVELIRALEEDTVSFSRSVNFSDIINIQTFKKVAIAAACFVAVSAAASWYGGKKGHLQALLARMLLMRVSYPTKTRVLGITEGTSIPRGESHEVEVRLDPDGYLPDTVKLVVAPVRGGKPYEYRMLRRFLFAVGLDAQSDLDGGRLPDLIRREFEGRRIQLPADVAVAREKEGGPWRIGGAPRTARDAALSVSKGGAEPGLAYFVERADEELIVCLPRRPEPEGAPAASEAAAGGDRDALSTYHTRLERVVEDVDYRAVAYDAKSEGWERLAVLRRPAIKSLSLRITYPAHTGKPEEESSAGDVKALEGSIVRIAAEFTKPVRSAKLRERLAFDFLEPAPMALDAGGTSARATLRVTRDGFYSILLEGRDGLENKDPTEYIVDAVPDREPKVKITFPGRDKTVTSFALWPIDFEARDDYGISRGWLKYRITRELEALEMESGEGSGAAAGDTTAAGELPGREAKGILGEFLLDGLVRGPGQREVTAGVPFDLKLLRVEPGHRVAYWIEIEDNRTPEPGVGKSREFAFTVAEREEVLEMIRALKEEALDRIERILEKEIETRDGVRRIRTRVRPQVEPEEPPGGGEEP